MLRSFKISDFQGDGRSFIVINSPGFGNDAQQFEYCCSTDTRRKSNCDAAESKRAGDDRESEGAKTTCLSVASGSNS